MMGLLLGSYLFAPLVGDSARFVGAALGALTSLHVAASCRGVGCLTLPWLNCIMSGMAKVFEADIDTDGTLMNEITEPSMLATAAIAARIRRTAS